VTGRAPTLATALIAAASAHARRAA
jgi:hypothetical protein